MMMIGDVFGEFFNLDKGDGRYDDDHDDGDDDDQDDHDQDDDNDQDDDRDDDNDDDDWGCLGEFCQSRKGDGRDDDDHDDGDDDDQDDHDQDDDNDQDDDRDDDDDDDDCGRLWGILSISIKVMEGIDPEPVDTKSLSEDYPTSPPKPQRLKKI